LNSCFSLKKSPLFSPPRAIVPEEIIFYFYYEKVNKVETIEGKSSRPAESYGGL
jgi:hypothetical protein